MEKTNEHPPPGNGPPQGSFVQPQPSQLYNTGQQPPQYQQQPPVYGGQPQPSYNQGYPNVQYVQPPTVLVVNQAPVPVQTEWIMPQAKIPAILLIVVAALNFVAFIGIGVTSIFYPEFIVASLIYAITGILGLIGAVRKQANQGVPIATLVMAVISLTMSIAQVATKSQAISLGQLWIRYRIPDGHVIVWVNVSLLIITLAAFSLSITLIVLPSKLVCSCCGGGGQKQSGGVVFAHTPQQHVAMNQQQYGQAMYQQQNQAMNAQQNPACMQYPQPPPQPQVSHIS